MQELWARRQELHLELQQIAELGTKACPCLGLLEDVLVCHLHVDGLVQLPSGDLWYGLGSAKAKQSQYLKERVHTQASKLQEALVEQHKRETVHQLVNAVKAYNDMRKQPEPTATSVNSNIAQLQQCKEDLHCQMAKLVCKGEQDMLGSRISSRGWKIFATR